MDGSGAASHVRSLSCSWFLVNVSRPSEPTIEPSESNEHSSCSVTVLGKGSERARRWTENVAYHVWSLSHYGQRYGQPLGSNTAPKTNSCRRAFLYRLNSLAPALELRALGRCKGPVRAVRGTERNARFGRPLSPCGRQPCRQHPLLLYLWTLGRRSLHSHLSLTSISDDLLKLSQYRLPFRAFTGYRFTFSALFSAVDPSSRSQRNRVELCMTTYFPRMYYTGTRRWCRGEQFLDDF
jgi:hypothetical protein